MTMIIPHSTLVQVSAPDTLAVLASTGPWTTIDAITEVVLGAATLGVMVGLLLVLLQLRKIGTTLATVAQGLEKESAPVMDRARRVAENVEFITMAVRTDVQKLTSSVAGLNDRLQEASEHMEERIQDFNALVEVLQAEAEDLALDTAAAVRGVRAGTRNLAAGGRSSRGAPPQQISGEPGSAPSLDPDLGSSYGEEEEEA